MLGRGEGTTTSQIISAPPRSVFVWVNGSLTYPKQLARKLGRLDLQIVGPRWLEYGWVGVRIPGLVIDHAACEHMTKLQFENIPLAYTRVVSNIEEKSNV